MKKVLGLMLIGCLSVGTLFANDRMMGGANKGGDGQNREEMKKERLSEAKQKTTERINERINMLEKAKGCINSANSKDDLEKCRPNKEGHDGQKQQMNNGGEGR